MSALRGFFTRQEEGQAVVFMAIFMLALIFAVGLAINAGQLYSEKRFGQEAADAAAFAGAVVLYQEGSVGEAIAAAYADAIRNGYDGTVVGTTVVVHSPPETGAYALNPKHVEVIITRTVKISLLPAQLNSVRSRGVAGAEDLNTGYAMMALDRGNSPGSFSASSNADIHISGGGILVNSSSSTAATSAQNSNARFNITPSTMPVDVHGQAAGSWPSQVIVNQNHVQSPDPFSGLLPPPPGSLPDCPSLAVCRDGSGYQIPGIYTVELGAAGGTTITLNSGIYILKNGINASGNADIVSRPGGVLIYNTYTNYPSPPGASPACGDIRLVGTAQSTLEAMTTGPWKHLLIYQDPACTTTMLIAGSGSFTGAGSVYLPSGKFQFNGNPSSLNGSQLIAKNIDIENGNITINFDASTSAQPVLPRLAE